jgi:serine phosphatase RsbU (regulator of sigma subunit)
VRWKPHGGGGGRARQQNRGLVWVPLALIVVITLADIFSPANIHLGPLLVVAPALTASFGGSRLTALIGLLAVGALLAISEIRNSITTSNHETQLVALVLVSGFTVVFTRVRERHSAELRQVRTVAETAQQVVLQPLPETMGPVRIAFTYQAAADQARIGGDLYAAVRTPEGTRLLIGDVRGKGLAAVDDASLLLGAFRSAAHRGLSLPALFAELEAIVWWGLSQPARDGEEAGEAFITAALVDVPDHGSEVHVLNCGHPPPLRLSRGRATALDPAESGPPLGVCPPRTTPARVDSYPFGPGDLLLLYTDGATEARDDSGAFYPLADRVAAFPGLQGPRDLVERVREDLHAYTGGLLGDDAALVAVARRPREEDAAGTGVRELPADAGPRAGAEPAEEEREPEPEPKGWAARHAAPTRGLRDPG